MSSLRSFPAVTNGALQQQQNKTFHKNLLRYSVGVSNSSPWNLEADGFGLRNDGRVTNCVVNDAIFAEKLTYLNVTDAQQQPASETWQEHLLHAVAVTFHHEEDEIGQLALLDQHLICCERLQ